jgi:hypothetical protein
MRSSRALGGELFARPAEAFRSLLIPPPLTPRARFWRSGGTALLRGSGADLILGLACELKDGVRTGSGDRFVYLFGRHQREIVRFPLPDQALRSGFTGSGGQGAQVGRIVDIEPNAGQ